eukprot:TRINITY_DN1895_c0_g1_i7.p2 TRINITY_DN1895_c0_g1~~TRINITY_DN1895_c0_g1_i7.p2  ORF type:complete len:233 (-),score=7.87 TRINITY_DN1895_c0_g1_i7:387-1085(-)
MFALIFGLVWIPIFTQANSRIPTVFAVPTYVSYGPNMLFDDEGESIKTVSGNDAYYDVTLKHCATACLDLNFRCPCCNSFSYQPSTKTCYLKKRSENASDAYSYNTDGWQSYKYWGVASSYGPGAYDGELDTADTYYQGDWGMSSDRISFIGRGQNQYPPFDGLSIKTLQGYDYLTRVDHVQCAKECLANEECDGIAYNPHQEGGKCYLKQGSSSSKYDTYYNEDGWTFFLV